MRKVCKVHKQAVVKNNMPSGHPDIIYIFVLVYFLEKEVDEQSQNLGTKKKKQRFVTQITTACLTVYMPFAACCSIFGHSAGHGDSESSQGPRRLSHHRERERFCRPATSSALWERWRMKLSVVSGPF